MKYYINTLFLFLLAAITLNGCKEEEGTEPGTDGAPVLTVYQYDAQAPENNPDNDVVIRIAANSRVQAAYYLVEQVTEKQNRVESDGETGYMQYVVENGTQIEGVSGASTVDVTITGIQGECAITIVGTDGANMISKEILFTGLSWTDAVAGTYVFAKQAAAEGTKSASELLGIESAPTILQVCTTDPNLYRFKDVFGEGYHIKINLLDQTGTDNGGEYRFFRVPTSLTPYTYGDYGSISVCDIGYWQGDDSFVTAGGYESGMYADHSCFVFVAYIVSAGSLTYGYDSFVPNE